MAMQKPPKACPIMEPVSLVPELMVVAAGKIFLGTIFEISAEKVGPENALMAPVAAMTKNIRLAMVQGFI